MSKIHHRQLRAAKDELQHAMNPNPIITKLESAFVLKQNDVDVINLGATPAEQVCRLVDCLLRKCDRAFDVFLDVLQEFDTPAATILEQSIRAAANHGGLLFLQRSHVVGTLFHDAVWI